MSGTACVSQDVIVTSRPLLQCLPARPGRGVLHTASISAAADALMSWISLPAKCCLPSGFPRTKRFQNPGPGQQQQQQMKTNTCPTLNSTCGSKYLLIFQWTLLTLQSVRVMPCCFVKTGATVTGRALDLTPFRNRLLQKPKLSNPKFLNEPTPNPCRALLSLRNPLKEA